MKILHRIFSVTLVTLCALGVIFMVSYCFNTHSFLTKITYELNASKTAYTVTGVKFQGSKHIKIPAEHNGKPVTAIKDAAFAGNYGLKSVTIPASVTKIGENPFDSTILENLYYEGDVASWCKISFEAVPNNQYYLYIGGKKLTDLEVPSSVKAIGNYSFAGVKDLKTVTMGDSVTKIGKSAFDSCRALTSVVIGNGVTKIEDNAFYKSENLATVSFGSSIETIGRAAFDYCDSLATVVLPASLKEIGNDAFNRCRALTYLTIGENVEKIGNFAFDNCSALTQVEIPEKVSVLNKGVFAHCSSLASISFHEGLETIGESAFSNCTSLTTLVIPSTVKTVGKQSFAYCTGLTSVSIAADSETGTTVIGQYAFQKANKIKTLIVGNGVTAVQGQAFSEATAIETLVFSKNIVRPADAEEDVKVVAQNAFYGVKKANTNVYYLGTAEEWAAAVTAFDKGNNNLINAQNLYFYSETQVEKGWHYVDGVPTAW